MYLLLHVPPFYQVGGTSTQEVGDTCSNYCTPGRLRKGTRNKGKLSRDPPSASPPRVRFCSVVIPGLHGFFFFFLLRFLVFGFRFYWRVGRKVMVMAVINYCLQLFYRRAYRMQQERLDRVLKRKREEALRRVSGKRQWRRQAQPSSWCQDGKGSSREIIPCLSSPLDVQIDIPFWQTYIYMYRGIQLATIYKCLSKTPYLVQSTVASQQQYSSTQVITKKRQPMLRSRVIFSPIREGASLSILHSLGSTTSVASLFKLFHVAEPTCSLLAVFPDISL